MDGRYGAFMHHILIGNSKCKTKRNRRHIACVRVSVSLFSTISGCCCYYYFKMEFPTTNEEYTAQQIACCVLRGVTIFFEMEIFLQFMAQKRLP